jgi:4'-phosphopantetheinyl transferase
MRNAQVHDAVSQPLDTSDVHIWQSPLAADATELASYAILLSEDEAARADRYVFDEHRARFTIGRGILRKVLSLYTGMPPEGIAFTYGSQGKPELAQPDNPPLHFNVAHSDNRLLISVTQGRMIGVDIEQMRPLDDLIHIAKRFFSARETEELHRLPTDQQPAAFFNAWTRKEAILKAYGEGISEVLNTVEVLLLPGGPAALISIQGRPEDAARWSLHALDAPHGYIAALAVEQPIGVITHFDYHAM